MGPVKVRTPFVFPNATHSANHHFGFGVGGEMGDGLCLAGTVESVWAVAAAPPRLTRSSKMVGWGVMMLLLLLPHRLDASEGRLMCVYVSVCGSLLPLTIHTGPA